MDDREERDCDVSGTSVVERREFLDLRLRALRVGGGPSSPNDFATLRNVTVRRVRIERAQVRGCILEDVVLDNVTLRSPVIARWVLFRRVVIRGRLENLVLHRAPRPAPLERELDDWVFREMENAADFALDIREADVTASTITTVPARRVRALPGRDFILGLASATKFSRRSPVGELGELVFLAKQMIASGLEEIVVPGSSADTEWNDLLRREAERGHLVPVSR